MLEAVHQEREGACASMAAGLVSGVKYLEKWLAARCQRGGTKGIVS